MGIVHDHINPMPPGNYLLEFTPSGNIIANEITNEEINTLIYFDCTGVVITPYFGHFEGTCMQDAKFIPCLDTLISYSSGSTCCGGKGGMKWDDKINKWNCSDCGKLMGSGTSGYYSTQPGNPYYLGDQPKPVKQCVCGGSKANTTHAFWCDIKN